MRNSSASTTFRYSWKRNLDTTTSIHFLCGFHIEIGDRYLPCSLLGEYRERLAHNRIVPDLAPMTVTKHQNRAWHVLLGRRSARRSQSCLFACCLLFPQPLDFVGQPFKLAGKIAPSIRHRRWGLFNNLGVRCCIDRVRQEHWLSKEEPIAKEELLAEEWVEEWIGET